MFRWLKRKNKELKCHSAIEETDAVWDECRELQKKQGWAEAEFDEELDKMIEVNANAHVRRLYGCCVLQVI